MAVPKIAAIALVAVIAVPILLGYALNLTEVTETGYVMSNDDLNVTPLLQDGYDYSYAAANTTDLNLRFRDDGDSPILPDFIRASTAKTSIPLAIDRSSGTDVPSATHVLSQFSYYYYILDYDPTGGYASMHITYNDDTTVTVEPFHSVYYDSENSRIYVWKYNYSGGQYTAGYFGIISDVKSLSYTKLGTLTSTGALYYSYSSSNSIFADLSSGYYLNSFNSTTQLDLPYYTKDLLISVDLSTITSSSYSFDMKVGMNPYVFRFEKTGGTNWAVKVSVNGGAFSTITNLYYDSSKSSNTYQIAVDTEGVSFNYVGAWPTIIGKANVYWDYRYDYSASENQLLFVYFLNGTTPKMRLDAATYRAFQYPVIENETYSPGQFRSNPATTINNPTIYGDSITFGGNTYAVSNGKITIGSHQIPVKGLVLNSVPVEGGYENRIGNTVISTTATPSTITFNGKWSVDITTASQTLTTYTKTEWNVGSFAWDGIDTNFLMVGLLTCLGAFIALGIYARKSRSGGIIPLMIVVGCAAMVFFIMI